MIRKSPKKNVISSETRKNLNARLRRSYGTRMAVCLCHNSCWGLCRLETYREICNSINFNRIWKIIWIFKSVLAIISCQMKVIVGILSNITWEIKMRFLDFQVHDSWNNWNDNTFINIWKITRISNLYLLSFPIRWKYQL